MAGCVVAGVTGHVGSGVATELLANREPVRVIVRDPAKSAAWSARGAEVRVGSLDDSAFLTAALEGSDGFFTLLPGSPMDPEYPDSMIPLGEAIAGAVRASGVPHVAALSSLGAELESGHGPIRVLHHFEQALRDTGTKLTAVRACYFQENLAGMLPAAKNGGIYLNFLSSADFRFPMIATRDLGPVAAAALLFPPAASEVVDVVGPEYSSRDIARILTGLLGKDLRVIDIPGPAQVASLRQAGFPERAAEAFVELDAAISAGILVPRGDRTVQGTTPVEETLRALVEAAS